MPPILLSSIALLLLLIVARSIKRGSNTLQRLFIPSSLVAGFIGLIMGPQILGAIPSEVTDYWAQFPKYLISVVFAGLFLGKFIPKARKLWKIAAPMIAFGNTLAFGQYVIGIALVLIFLGPVFGVNPLAGALIEISFEGGHGTAAGLAPTFEKLGWPEGTDIALGLATFSIIAAILTGIIMINIYKIKTGTIADEAARKQQERQMIKSGYNLTKFTGRFIGEPRSVLINLAAFAAAITIGWLLLKLFIFLEAVTLGPFTDLRFFIYLPLFPLAMIGGLIIQLTLAKTGKVWLIDRKTANTFSSIALDLLIASALATVSLEAIGNNMPIFITLGLAGVAWIIGGFLLLAPRMFPKYWFENGLTNVGQSMGMTATGLLLNRLVDPTNKAKAVESFGYKQLAFGPFVGGGIVTAGSVIIIHEFGAVFTLIAFLIITLFWLILGIRMAKVANKPED